MRPRLDRNYTVPDSDDEDMEVDPEEIQQGHLCTSADPRRIGTGGGETIILSPEELRKAITLQQSIDDQSIWLRRAQAGFPLTMDKEKLVNSKDAQMGRPTARHFHPAISAFIADIQAEPQRTAFLPARTSSHGFRGRMVTKSYY